MKKGNKIFKTMALILFIMQVLCYIACNGDSGAPDLSGNITISPNIGIVIGTVLTATYSGTETVTYQWKRGNINVGTNLNSYTPDQTGNYSVTVSATGFNSKTSASVNVLQWLGEYKEGDGVGGFLVGGSTITLNSDGTVTMSNWTETTPFTSFIIEEGGTISGVGEIIAEWAYISFDGGAKAGILIYFYQPQGLFQGFIAVGKGVDNGDINGAEPLIEMIEGIGGIFSPSPDTTGFPSTYDLCNMK